MQKLVGGFYKNGKRIGEVTVAIQISSGKVYQFGQAAPIEDRERILLKVDASVPIGLGENKNVYEVDSEPNRIRVYPETSEPDSEGSRVVVTLTP